MRSRRQYLGTEFDVWGGHPGWFWMVVSPNRDGGGTIGSAATRADALDEARAVIESMSARDDASHASRAADGDQCGVAPWADAIRCAEACWKSLFADLERHLVKHERAIA